MGFWKKFGKIALKVAPYAAMAIPGVGVPLGMALQGGLAAANAKASGAGWKGTLLSGGLGAAAGGVGAGALKGIGPSAGVGAKLAKGALGAGGAGKAGMVGQFLGDIGREAAYGATQPQSQQMAPESAPTGLGPSAPPPAYNPIMAGREAARKRVVA